jgi:hypothetical protein
LLYGEADPIVECIAEVAVDARAVPAIFQVTFLMGNAPGARLEGAYVYRRAKMNGPTRSMDAGDNR